MLVSLDIETKRADHITKEEGARDYDALIPHKAQITVIGLYAEDGTSKVFRGPNKVEDVMRHLSAIKDLELTGQNFKFDIKHLVYHGADAEFLIKHWKHDSQLLGYVNPNKINQAWLDNYEEQRVALNKTLPRGVSHRTASLHSLKTMAPYFLDVEPFWEDPSDHNNDEYVIKDCKYTLELTRYFLENLHPSDLAFYSNHQLPWTKELLRAELKGIDIDTDEMHKLQNHFDKERVQSANKINEQWEDAFKVYADEQFELERERIEAMRQRALLRAKDTAKCHKTHDEKIAKIEVEPFNLDSPTQLKWLLRDYLQLDITKTDGSESTDKEVLETLAATNNEVQNLLDYRKYTKLCTSYFPSYKDLIVNDKIHTVFNPTGTRTGRLSCIEENELIEIPGGQKPIKDIKPGDYVYTMTDDNKVTLRKVLNTMNMGIKECVEVKWQSSGSGDIGRLICTDDHHIKHKYRGWVQAKDLKQYDKLVHLRKKLQANGRIRIYSTNKFMELEESVIKREYFKADSKMHIHHINEDKKDNRLENLEVLTAKEHTSFHGKEYTKNNPDHWKHLLKGIRPEPKYLKEHSCWIEKTKYQLLKELAKSGGRPSKCAMDFSTFKRKCELEGINLKEVCKRYNAAGDYISAGKLMKVAHKDTRSKEKELRLGYYHIKELYNYYGLCGNHMVLKVTPIGKRVVYDLEIEGTHNFIASEICVHNSSHPNLQQVPKEVRPMFRAPKGYKYISLDLGAIEPRLLAYYSEDKTLCDVFLNNGDFHGTTAIAMFSYIDCDSSEVKKFFPKERGVAKTLGLSILYGSGIKMVKEILIKQGFTGYSESDYKKIVYGIRDMYKDVWRFKQDLDKELESGSIIYNILGRPFKIENKDNIYMTGMNTLIQGSASDIVQESMYQFNQKAEDEARVLALVHDEIFVITKDFKADYYKQLLDYCMTSRVLSTKYGNIPLITEGEVKDIWTK